MGTLNRRALFGFLRDGERRGPAIIRPRERMAPPEAAPTGNLPAVREEEAMPLIDPRLSQVINPEQGRRGFLSMMGQIGARLALRTPAGRVAERFTGANAREEIIRRELERYSQDFGRFNELLMEAGGDWMPLSPEAAWVRPEMDRLLNNLVRDPHRIATPADPNWPTVPASTLRDNVMDTGQLMPHSLPGFGDEMAAALARRSGMSEAEVRRVLGNPEQYDRYLLPMTRASDDLTYMDAPHQYGIIRRDDLIRDQLTPEGSTLTPRHMEDLWRSAPDLYGAAGPAGVQRHLDAYEPWVARSAAYGVGVDDARLMHPHIPEDVWRRIERDLASDVVEEPALIMNRAGEPSDIHYPELYEPPPALPAPQNTPRNLPPEQSVLRRRRPVTIDQMGDMVEEVP